MSWIEASRSGHPSVESNRAAKGICDEAIRLWSIVVKPRKIPRQSEKSEGLAGFSAIVEMFKAFLFLDFIELNQTMYKGKRASDKDF